MREKEKKEKVKAFLSAIQQELSSIYLDYINGLIGLMNEKGEGQYIDVHLHIIYDFPIYKNNVKDIGLVDDENLRDAIIVSYALAESLVSKCQQNNQYNREFHEAMIAHTPRENQRMPSPSIHLRDWRRKGYRKVGGR